MAAMTEAEKERAWKEAAAAMEAGLSDDDGEEAEQEGGGGGEGAGGGGGVLADENVRGHWRRCADEHGSFYYENIMTGQSSWEAPAEFQ